MSSSINLMRFLQLPAKALGAVLLWLIAFYRQAISPLLRPRCRYLPTCSEYASESLKKYGLMKGLGRTIHRMGRCHPLGGCGYDPP